jgi:tRNA threonylcarbamoyladenosine biosynthesis protein TsaB
MVFIARILKKTRIDLKEIDILAAGIGPGLYTGLRIGLSLMKGLAISIKKPLVGIPTLDTIACNFSGAKDRIAILLNAYGGEVYGAIYNVEETIKREGGYFVGPIDKMLKMVKGKTIFAGTGIAIYRQHIIDALGKDAVFAKEGDWIPHPVALTKLAIRKFKSRRIPGPDTVLPMYLKESEAERKWKISHSRN